LALASDGTLLVNFEQLDLDRPLAVTLARVRRWRGPLFIGVPCPLQRNPEARIRLESGFAETAAFLVGGRQRW
jgi:hypothetical protein